MEFCVLKLYLLFILKLYRVSTVEHSGYSEPCDDNRPCTPNRALECRPESESDPTSIRQTCRCTLGSLHVAAFEGCLAEPNDSNDWHCKLDSQCHLSDLGRLSYCYQKKCACLPEFSEGDTIQGVTRLSNYCYGHKDRGDLCVHDVQCDSQEQLRCVNDSSGSGIRRCACDPETHWEVELEGQTPRCWPLDRPFPCTSLEDCESAIGDLVTCDAAMGHCKCSDTWDMSNQGVTGFYQGKCYLKRNLGESCETNGECRIGSNDVNCDRQKNVCMSPSTSKSSVAPVPPYSKIISVVIIFVMLRTSH